MPSPGGWRGPASSGGVQVSRVLFLFTSEGKIEREIDRRIGAASAVMRSVYRTVVVKKELSRKAVAGRSLRDRVRSSVTREELGVEPLLLRDREESAEVAWASVSDAPGRLPREVFQACPTGRRPRGRPRTRWRDYVSRLAWERLGSPAGRAGGSVWGEGSLGISAQTAASATRSRTKRMKKMKKKKIMSLPSP
ncbi:hypothetical protein L3Q82_019888, partial [Scortum barcoo]